MDYLDIGLWFDQGLLALAFLGAGAMKAVTPRDQLMSRMRWVARFPAWAPRAIGIAEVTGALGMVLPWATGILPVLTPIAAACLVVLMVGAIRTHLADGETAQGIAPGVLGLLALVVAIGRAVPLP